MNTVSLSKVVSDFSEIYFSTDPGVGGFAVLNPYGEVYAVYHSPQKEPAEALAKTMGDGYECCEIVEG
jgi:hypothetical protein